MHRNPATTPPVEHATKCPTPAPTTVPPQARRRSRIRRQLIDGFSHDVRTPITVINEYLSLLTDDFDGAGADERRKTIDVISDRVDDLNRSCSNFLDALRLAERRPRVSPCTCTLADIVAPIQSSLERKAAIRNVTAVFDFHAGLSEVFCDKEQIGRVIFNLAAGTINNCPHSGVVQVWAAPADERREVVVGITDQDQIIPSAAGRNASHTGQNSENRGLGCGRSVRQQLRLARQLLRCNLAKLETATTRDATNFWFGLPVPEPVEITARYLKKQQRRPVPGLTVSLAKLWCAQLLDRSLERDVHSFLAMLLGPSDLLLPVGRGTWLLAFCRKETALASFDGRMRAMQEKVNQKRLREPLPELHFDSLGTWRPSDRMRPVLETVKTAFEIRPTHT